jgi:hypothetical protein
MRENAHMTRVAIPPLSIAAAEHFASILGNNVGDVEVSRLTPADAEHLLVVLEAELFEQGTGMSAEIKKQVSDLAAALLEVATRGRS